MQITATAESIVEDACDSWHHGGFGIKVKAHHLYGVQVEGAEESDYRMAWESIELGWWEGLPYQVEMHPDTTGDFDRLAVRYGPKGSGGWQWHQDGRSGGWLVLPEIKRHTLYELTVQEARGLERLAAAVHDLIPSREFYAEEVALRRDERLEAEEAHKWAELASGKTCPQCLAPTT